MSSQRNPKKNTNSTSAGTVWFNKLTPDDIGEVTHAKRKHMRTVVSPQMAKYMKRDKTNDKEKEKNINQYASHIVDLTMIDEKYDLPGTPTLFKVRHMNRVWFDYNPSGYNSGEDLPLDYCLKCRCPKEYCADIVFGYDCVEYTNSEVLMKKGREGMTLEGITKVFKKNYVEMVFSKMVVNKCMYTIDTSIKERIAVPKCITRQSLRKFLLKNKVVVKEEKIDIVSI